MIEYAAWGLMSVGLVFAGWYFLIRNPPPRNDDATHGGGYESSPVDPPADGGV